MKLEIDIDFSERPQTAVVTKDGKKKSYKYHFIKKMTLNDIILDHDKRL